MQVHSPAQSEPAKQPQAASQSHVALLEQRPQETLQLQLMRMMNTSAQMANNKALQAMMDGSVQTGSTQAFQRMANSRTATSAMPMRQADGVAQRVVLPFKTPAMPTAEELLIIADANAIDALTNAAYANTMARLAASVALVPTPLDIADFPGVSDAHFALMIDRLQGDDNALKAAAVGYVIEEQVTFGGGLPATAAPQMGVGNAIPDFVITRGVDGAQRRGIIDITSSGQMGHVLDKDFNIGPFSVVWESIYPSIDFTALGAGAVAMAPATAALVDASKRRRANTFITSNLYRINRNLELLREGVMHNDDVFRTRAERLSTFLLGLPRDAAWSGIHIGVTNTYIGDVNALLPADHRLHTLTDLITAAQDRYLLAGAPIW
jgi:hypothetical protein